MNYSSKKPYISADYEEMRSTLMDSEIYNPNSPQRNESEFKKPYLYDEHPKSEQTYTPPGGFQPNPPWHPPGPGGDCVSGGDAVGGAGQAPCDDTLSCGQWMFTCAHKIKSFTAAGGYIKSVRYQSNDVAVVTACWDERKDTLTVRGLFENGKFVEQVIDRNNCLGEGHDDECTRCEDCPQVTHPPVIFYGSQQLSINQTANIHASGGAGGPYTWTITSGSGSLSSTITVSGANVTYTAPSSNAGCNNNPTIVVTDFCGNTASVKFAINAWSPATSTAGANTHLVGNMDCSFPPVFLRATAFSCIGVENDTQGCLRCCAKAGGCWVYDLITCDETRPACNEANLVAACIATDPFGCNTAGDCPVGIHDHRTSDMLTQGCCPRQLL